MSGSKPGERRGGRQKGTPNKKTTELIERAEVTGQSMPADMMLDLARDAYERWKTFRDPQTGVCLVPVWRASGADGEAVKPDKIEVIDWGKRAMGYAAECAPYYHATMKSVEMTGETVVIERIVSDAPLDKDEWQLSVASNMN